ncbi:DNA-binding response regulator [Actinoplanes cyaneus]|uniref:DNA-binding response regulator n=1 Tax=Actinoplanes cyaneus TaxID=52696 RepID=A0A919IHD7_9ACTN|nr:response regulator transcription factor [Actinoplanes cyaneus]MCW2140208.1 two component transcriptional regulator, LuxR family [Actinoplanes cyaneus]GID65523.1 DNA-binding response regulator [Actinoplanes cyaneus]
MIRVLIVEDVALVRDSFKLLVDSSAECTAVGEAGTGIEAVRLAGELRPDVVLMDVRMPELDGIEATRLICRNPELADVRVLILTTFDHDEYVYGALRAGASGFLLKDSPAAELLNAIRVVAAGDSLLSPKVTRKLVSEFTRQPKPQNPIPGSLDSVTEREREVLRLVGLGMSNIEIADHLALSLATVKTHIGRILAKLPARDRAQLVIVAYETGLVSVNS